MTALSRRMWLQQLGLLGLSAISPGWLSLTMRQLLTRKIPSSGEPLPSVGVGTWQTFDVGESDAERNPLREVLKNLVAEGGRVIDSSPMYGRSEDVVGDLAQELNLNQKLFFATKVWTSGAEAGKEQMKNSFRLFRRKTIDLMQVHNLTDWKTHLKTLQKWKEEGRIRYIGLTHYLDSSHETMEKIIRQNPIDFIQINYSVMSRHAESRLFPAAIDQKVAVLINRPFEEGALFNKVKGKQLPEWAVEFDCQSWAQFFLKFILSHPAVTCVIPGTSKLKHLLDNIGAGKGKLPDEKQRQKMISLLS
ncbi:MAG: aldo/keto reductase [Bacteroidota bacterium]